MSHRLDVYIDQNCTGCVYAIHLANEIQDLFPQLEVRIFDLTRPNNKKPASVFAVPTFVLNDTRIWLGNPDKGNLVEKLRETILFD